MSVRVVARIRPLLRAEIERDVIVQAASSDEDASSSPDIIRIPNPKNQAEDFSFHFNGVYDSKATQEDLFQREVAPTLKSLFQGLDVTLFAYGVTGTGKTHTMRGGKSLADRGLIPRLLSGIYRRGRKLNKDSQGATAVEVAMSYYEIYNDRVFDLFEAQEKRTATGLPLREQNGKTVVVGLTERPCGSLKEFEQLYDQANTNRSTSATKLNAVSSRSHAILRVKVTITTGAETRVSTASAIDLAGSEDNRRTENGKERLVESASINKSLFVLAQCVEAISKKQSRIPYRESKMTRILSLGQNQGVTIMILNLAPVKSFHLDTLSSLNFANRTKKIQVKEIENEPIFRGPPLAKSLGPLTGATIQRQPLRALATTASSLAIEPSDKRGKPAKAFFVYSDRGKTSLKGTGRKRDSDPAQNPRPAKVLRTSDTRIPGKGSHVTKASLEEIVERKVEELLAARALNETAKTPVDENLSEEVQRRLEMLEERIDQKDDSRAEGLTFLLMAKQHHVRGEDTSALKMYQLAAPHFPNNTKLASKIQALEEKLRQKRAIQEQPQCAATSTHEAKPTNRNRKRRSSDAFPSPAQDRPASPTSSNYEPSPKPFRQREHTERPTYTRGSPTTLAAATAELLTILNSRCMAQIQTLQGVGARKAAIIVEGLQEVEQVEVLAQVEALKGVGTGGVRRMLEGLGAWL
ncbi:MAG: hypothetical protein M1832_003153 [Thelocarpon impressellum]|nr:MAG: hypothetical protein M1832_003153 [Thelocarpon impressellum]